MKVTGRILFAFAGRLSNRYKKCILTIAFLNNASLKQKFFENFFNANLSYFQFICCASEQKCCHDKSPLILG
jgi:general stress protein CsbA